MVKQGYEKKYNVGLDIGDTSVGWAVVDSVTNKIIKRGKNDNNERLSLWGVRLFNIAETAANRREKRSIRRRYDRRRTRINLLRKEFADEINKIDLHFYDKLKESFYSEKDTYNKKYLLTTEDKSQIKKYYEKYPTIYHLRDSLIKSTEKFDIRLVYLAIHHIIKYRGNFLYPNESFNVDSLNIETKLEEFINGYFSNIENNEFMSADYENIVKCFSQDSKKDTAIMLKQELSKILSKEISKVIADALVGYKFSISKLFNLDIENDIKISLSGTDYEDKIVEIENLLQDKIEVLESLKQLYDTIFLKSLFKNSKSLNISAVMVEKYNKHKKNLILLKKILKDNRIEYNKIFKTNGKKICLYDKYMNNSDLEYDNKKFLSTLKISLEKVLNRISYTDEIKKLLKEIENEEVILPKITDIDNGKYPYQLNSDELVKILENQGVYYPFLLNKVENEYKLKKLLKFRIPYYVGPLHNYVNNEDINNPNMWMIRRENNKIITPYNFDSIVDKEASAELFIMRMTQKCTYLLSESAIPANSILYSEFKVLNELKQIRVNEIKFTVEQVKRIYEELFLKNDSGSQYITEKSLKNFLKTDKDFAMYTDFVIKGYSSEDKFANNMQSYIDFFGSEGIFKDTLYTIEDAEEIIRWITIFEDKTIVIKKINMKYELSDQAIKKIMNKKYKGWSSLSRVLLEDIKYKDKETNSYFSIIDLMCNTDENFMQILNNKKYNFQNKIDKYNSEQFGEITKLELINQLATSPAIKRGIYQSLAVIDEIIRYMGKKPEKVIIEMARGAEKKQRNDSRKNYIEKIYNACKNDVEDYKRLSLELKSFEKINDEKLFLYFIQEGKSLYSGKRLNIEQLDKYEIDHILPQTLIKDDSIDNKALVLKEENQKKAYSLVLPSEYRNDYTMSWWKKLIDKKLISKKKYNNLIRKNYSDKDIEGFINRQLVETRQITKHVASIIKKYYNGTDVIYLPSSLSSNYRKKFELFKFREINNFHHAHDAYLAAVLGNYKEKYINKVNFDELRNLNKKYYDNHEYYKLNYGYVINSLDNNMNIYNNETGEIIFSPSEFNKIVEHTLYRNDVLVSKKTEIKSGGFYNQTKKPKGNKGVNLKDNMPTALYGAYTKLNPTYAMVVEYQKGKKLQRKMIGIPILVVQKMITKPAYLNEYICGLLNLNKSDTYKIIKDKIPFNSHFDWDGQDCYLVGASDYVEVCNAKELKIDSKNMNKWKYTFNRLLNNKGKIDNNCYDNDLEEIINYILNKIDNEYNLYKNLIPQLKSIVGTEKNKKLSIEQKEKLIRELLNLLKTNSTNANLKDFGLSSAFGKKNDKIIASTKIINHSITGIWSSKSEF